MNRKMETEIEKYINETVKYAPDKERLRLYIHTYGVNPLMGEITYNNNYGKKENRYVKGTIIVSFEIYLARAWETGQFLGIDIIEHHKDTELISIEAVGKRNINGNIATLSFNAYLSEYKPKTGLSEYSPWIKMPSVMLRKCAIANVVRQLFADSLRLPYIQEEIDSGDNKYDSNTNNPAFDTDDNPIDTNNGDQGVREVKAVDWSKRIEEVSALYNILISGEELSEDQNRWINNIYNNIEDNNPEADLLEKLERILDFCKKKSDI